MQARPGRPLEGRRIVITRAEPDAAHLAGRLRDLGAHPIIVPAIRIEFTEAPELDRALARLRDYDWIIFTSRHAVEAVFRRAARLEGPPPRAAAVGRATASGLRMRGVEPDLVPAEYVGEGILEALGEVRGRRFLLPRADIARRALPDGLRERGAVVEEIVVYHTRSANAPRPDLTGVDAVTFTSSSTVRGFVESGPVPAGAKVICIGPVTAKTAREYGLDVNEVAAEYTEEGLLAALIAALGS